MASARDRWGGRLPFIMAAIGSAVGLGNVWRFPYTAYENGGGAFFIPYFVALITAGIPLLVLEYALGQKFQAGAPGAMARIGKRWRWLGWFAIFVGLSISFYYCQIMALSWHYMLASPSKAWEAPVDNRTVFEKKYRLYSCETEKKRIEAELKRKKISHVRLFPEEESKAVKDKLASEIKETWGDETVVYKTVQEVVDFASSYFENREQLEKEDPKVRFAVMSAEEFAALDEALAAFWAEKEGQRYADAGADDELGILPEEKIRVIDRQENVGLYFMEEALGGFGTGVENWSRATVRNDMIDRALEILEKPEGDLNRLFKTATPEETAAVEAGEAEKNPDWDFTRMIPGLSKHASSAYQDLREAHAALTAVEEPPEPLCEREADARADLVKALEAKRLQRSSAFSFSWHLVFWAFITWLIIFLIIFKGVHVVGKVVMITVPLPVALLGIIILHGLTLNGAGQGLEFFLNPDWDLIKDTSVWVAAYGQIFFSLSLGFGIMIAYASYMPRESDVSNNAFMTAFGNCCTSFYASFAVFSVLGYLAVALNKEVADVVNAGPGLVFVTYPVALSEMGAISGGVVGFLFFLSLLTLGIDSAFSIVEAFVTGVRDYLMKVNKTLLTAVICGIGFVATLLYCTRSGLMWLDIVDKWMSNYGLPIVVLLECIAIGYFFRIEEIRGFVNERSEILLKGWWDACVKFVTPAILFVILFKQVLDDLKTPYGGYDKVLPDAVNVMGWGYFGLLILLAFLLTRSWLHVAWVATAVVFGFLLRLYGLPLQHAVLGGIGFMLLFGGLVTCIQVARQKGEEKEEEEEALHAGAPEDGGEAPEMPET